MNAAATAAPVATMSIDEFHAALKAQGMPRREHVALKCPVCKTVQSMRDLERAGVAAEDIDKFFGFSCVGRFTGAGPKKKGDAPGRGCDWTLGGLFQLHELEIVTPDGHHHPRFAIATAAEAQALMESNLRRYSVEQAGGGVEPPDAVEDEQIDPELLRMVARADISTPEKMAAFKRWQNDDGSKAGLAALLEKQT
jgi:hypothetical protein